MAVWWHRAQLSTGTTPNTRQLLSSTETIYIYASVQQFEPIQNWFIIPPLSLNWNLNLQFSSDYVSQPQFGSGSVQVRTDFRTELRQHYTTGHMYIDHH